MLQHDESTILTTEFEKTAEVEKLDNQNADDQDEIVGAPDLGIVFTVARQAILPDRVN